MRDARNVLCAARVEKRASSIFDGVAAIFAVDAATDFLRPILNGNERGGANEHVWRSGHGQGQIVFGRLGFGSRFAEENRAQFLGHLAGQHVAQGEGANGIGVLLGLSFFIGS